MKPPPETEDLPPRLLGLVGQGVDAIETPSLVVDADALGRNIQRMAEFAVRHRVKLRPHAKMHKSVEIARLQMQAGAVGICVQKISEAEIMASGGLNDIFISNEVIAPSKLLRVAALAYQLQQRGGRLAIAVDSHEGIESLAHAMRMTNAAIDVLVEIDVGQGRCGASDAPEALQLVLELVRGPSQLRFAGLHAYHGGAQHLRTPDERRAAIAQAAVRVRAVRELLAEAEIEVPLVTGAGTGSFSLEAASGAWDELQPGSYLFMDASYARNHQDNTQPRFEHALFVKSQVISVAPDRVVVDAGHKSHAIDSGMPLVHAQAGQAPMNYTDAGDEHGILRLGMSGSLPRLGATTWLIPGHCDPTVNLHDVMIFVRGGLQDGRVESIIRVDARGAVN
ncbi:DSD1 family PLP-dependent enzyme [Ottowia thiooxydans]|uniref:DSD1 family PLP-dependent enzyme n=1 Tax=Ottowia thiooxydans TaxID=219182 RepID=UPI00041AEF95|nr:DSD1 family PLP-dependent enzyme [Ottowia thiooxydans]